MNAEIPSEATVAPDKKTDVETSGYIPAGIYSKAIFKPVAVFAIGEAKPTPSTMAN